MDERSAKKIISDFISQERLAVISTMGPDDEPQGAVIEFGQTDAFEIIFDTFSRSRKYKNILNNPHVALTIGWEKNITVQYEGIAYELSEDELERAKQIYFQKNPKAQKWENVSGIVFFKVEPTWIRYSDLNVDPWEVFEVTFHQ